MKNLYSIIRTLWACLLLGCGFSSVRAASEAHPSTDYQLQSGDIVRIQVFQEPDLDRELRVSQEGVLAFPLIGSVDVRGKSLGVLEKLIRERYDNDYIVNPQVTLTVVKYQTRTVNVIGAVNAPQAVEYPPEQTLTLLDAISRAGGFNRFADRKKVKLTRTFLDGHSENYIINTDQLIAGSSTEKWPLVKDDVIFVPESVL